MSATHTIGALSPLHQQWHEQQQQFKASGLTASAYCQLNKVNLSTFYNRRERLAQLLEHKLKTDTSLPFIEAGTIKALSHDGSASPATIDSNSRVIPPFLTEVRGRAMRPWPAAVLV